MTVLFIKIKTRPDLTHSLTSSQEKPVDLKSDSNGIPSPREGAERERS